MRLGFAVLALTVAALGCPKCESSRESAPAAIVRTSTGSASSPLGTNLAFMKDWSGEYAFADAFKQSRAWFSGRSPEAPGGFVWDDKRPLELDEHGWVRSLAPGQVARTVFYWFDQKIKLRYPKGDYLVLYDGEGTIVWENATVRESGKNRQVITPNVDQGGFALFITATNPSNYLRNIRVIVPGGEGHVFHPTFLDRIKAYSTIRFKDWQDTDNSKQREWSDRPKVDDARWTVEGVPIEIICDLANRMHADAWVNVPHLGSDGWATGLAEYLRDHLDPKLKIYIEFSNEVWNSFDFDQARWARTKGMEEGLSRDPNEAQLFWYSKRSTEIFDIFERVLGKARIVRVMASAEPNPAVSEMVLGFRGAAKKTDALAIGAYFGNRLGQPQNEARLREGIDALFADLPRELEGVADFFRRHAAVAKKHGVELIVYEGGEHLRAYGPIQDDAEINALFDRAAYDPRMKEIYRRHLQNWKDSGGHLFVHFLNCVLANKYGRAGALLYLDQPREEAPKFDALQEFIEKNPRWW